MYAELLAVAVREGDGGCRGMGFRRGIAGSDLRQPHNANWYTSAIDTYDICFVLDV
jgi:hypothetical protein